MKVVNLQAWAGLEFSFTAGEILELPDEMALARIEAGLASPVEGDGFEEPKKARRKKASEAGE